MNPTQDLPFHDLAERHVGVTRAVGETYTEAARVCLDRHHGPPVDFELADKNVSATGICVRWLVCDQRTRNAWANDTDATRDGAYAMAIAAVEIARGLFAVHRAETLTGADYYIAPLGKSLDDLETCFRLEVSGVGAGARSVVEQRLKTKLLQTQNGISNLPAVAGIVGFAAKLILLATLEKP